MKRTDLIRVRFSRRHSVISSSLLAAFLIIVLAAIVFAQPANTAKPLGLLDIGASLRESKTGLPTTNRILIKQVEERGLTSKLITPRKKAFGKQERTIS